MAKRESLTRLYKNLYPFPDGRIKMISGWVICNSLGEMYLSTLNSNRTECWQNFARTLLKDPNADIKTLKTQWNFIRTAKNWHLIQCSVFPGQLLTPTNQKIVKQLMIAERKENRKKLREKHLKKNRLKFERKLLSIRG